MQQDDSYDTNPNLSSGGDEGGASRQFQPSVKLVRAAQFLRIDIRNFLD